MYKVIKQFADLNDGKHLYSVGDVFPREGVKASEDRLNELSGSGNKCGEPLIREDVSEASGGTKKTKTDVSPSKSSQAKGRQRRKQEKA